MYIYIYTTARIYIVENSGTCRGRIGPSDVVVDFMPNVLRAISRIVG